MYDTCTYVRTCVFIVYLLSLFNTYISFMIYFLWRLIRIWIKLGEPTHQSLAQSTWWFEMLMGRVLFRENATNEYGIMCIWSVNTRQVQVKEVHPPTPPTKQKLKNLKMRNYITTVFLSSELCSHGYWWLTVTNAGQGTRQACSGLSPKQHFLRITEIKGMCRIGLNGVRDPEL